MFDSRPGGICGPAGVEAGAAPLGGAQPQQLAAAGVGQLRAGHDGLVVLQPGDAGCGRAFHVAGQDCGEAQHHRHLRGLTGALDDGRS